MNERRAYDRIRLLIPATIFMRNSDGEVLCDIVDMSEEGMRVRIASNLFVQLKLKCNDSFTFQFMDVYKEENSIKRDIISAEAKIVYIESGFGIHELGCYICSDTYAKYVAHKKMLNSFEVVS